MSLIYKKATISPSKKSNKLNDSSINVNTVFKHLLKCKSCLWKITFYESTESISIDNKKIHCPYARKKK